MLGIANVALEMPSTTEWAGAGIPSTEAYRPRWHSWDPSSSCARLRKPFEIRENQIIILILSMIAPCPAPSQLCFATLRQWCIKGGSDVRWPVGSLLCCLSESLSQGLLKQALSPAHLLLSGLSAGTHLDTQSSCRGPKQSSHPHMCHRHHRSRGTCSGNHRLAANREPQDRLQ